MKTLVVVTCLAAIAMPASAQNGVFKCTGAEGTVVYQGVPCRAQQQQVTLVEPRKREPEALAVNTPVPNAAAEVGERRPLASDDALVVGMSDTKVLNLRGWGRPQNITRTRAEDGWRESWTYASRADGETRQVHFLNGKVAGIGSQDTQQVARAAARVETQRLVEAATRVPPQPAEQPAKAAEPMQIVEGLIRSEPPRQERSAPAAEPSTAANAVVSAPPSTAPGTAYVRPPLPPVSAQPPGYGSTHAPASNVQQIPPPPSPPMHIVRTEPPVEASRGHPPFETIVHTKVEQPAVPYDAPVAR